MLLSRISTVPTIMVVKPTAIMAIGSARDLQASVAVTITRFSAGSSANGSEGSKS